MKIHVNELSARALEKGESLLFNGNGFLGVRGNLEEAYYDFYATNRETYLNGFYETKAISYPEKMVGFTETGETMISVIDGQTTFIIIGGERFSITSGTVEQHERYVDLERGKTVRDITWKSPQGRITRIILTRMASFDYQNLMVMHYAFTKVNHNETITLETHLNMKPVKTIDSNDPRMSHETQHVAVTAVDLTAQRLEFTAPVSGLEGELQWHCSEIDQQTLLVDDKIVITSTVTGDSWVKKLSYGFNGSSHRGLSVSFEQLIDLQTAYLSSFWDDAKVSIGSEDGLEESVNYGIYALLQSVGREGSTSISAKGLSGSGYEGHYFWDSEMYVFPVFLALQPDIAKQMLMFRINTLEAAKKNRAMFGYQQGALYPWRTISGSESSAYFEAGSAQHHINADIAYAFISYYEQTGDLDFIIAGGFEVLLETARVFTELLYQKEGLYHLDKVTGPDEYTVLVNDNYYTNRMIAHQFNWIDQFARLIESADSQRWQQLVEKLDLDVAELKTIKQMATKMALPFDEIRGILKQDRDFLELAEWPLSVAQTRLPLLLHYHPLTIYRYQVSKQADAVLALMLFPDDFSEAVTRKTIAYYDKITTHDSTLSYSTFATVYSRLGETEKAYAYFLKNARVDLDNLHGNTKDGIHTASIGGTFMTLLNGFCQLKVTENGPEITPQLPQAIESIRFKTTIRGQKYAINVTHTDASITQIEGEM